MNFRKNRGKIPASKNLENTALAYLGRYAASEKSLQRVLENRIRRAALRNPEFARDRTAQAQLRAAIAAIIEKYRKSGALNDAAFAETKAISMRRAGRSARAIRQSLAQKGVAKTAIERALAGDEEVGAEEAELKAARALAKKRRWGPFGARQKDTDKKRKELAALARAGFSLSVARKVLEAEELDEE